MREQIESSLKKIKKEIELAKDEVHRSDEVMLVGVSKFQSIEKIKIAYELGLRDFGENYVQEGVSKIEEMRKLGLSATFHFIGALQTNKAKEAVKYFDVIQSVDSLKLVDAISKAVVSSGKGSQDIFIQVNVSKENQKSGIQPEDCNELFSYARSKPEIRILGLMAIGSFTEDLSVKRAEFVLLRQIKERLESDFSCILPHLSMGMSDDFSHAIKEGATVVRIGSLLFGDRDKSN